MIVYNYDERGVLIGSIEIDGDSVPAMATSMEPPVAGDGEVAVFNGMNWAVVEKSVDVPQVITPQQFHRGLNKAGLYEQAVAMASADFDTKIYFEKSLEFARNHPLLVAMAKDGFGLSDEQIDAMFVEWGKL